MRVLVLSLLIGLAVGAAYALLNVRSPAPSLAALLGLAGILIGETCTQAIVARMAEHRAVAALQPDEPIALDEEGG